MRAARYPFQRFSAGLLTAACIAFTGCGKADNESAGGVQKKTPPKAAADADSSKTNEIRMAHFTLEKGLRDPFFPNSKKLPPGVQPEVKTAPPVNVAALLQEGLQGIMGAGSDRLAVIHNVILEAGKKTEIPVSINGTYRTLKVRCMEVSSNRVILEVEGQPQPITVTTKTPSQ